MNRDIQEQRRELWCAVYIAVANASNSTRPAVCKVWADRAVADFDETFKED